MALANSEGAGENSPISASRVAKLSRLLIWLLFPVSLGLAITRQSLWIDEGFTAWFASHQSFRSFYSALIGSPGAPGDPQLLFYLLYMWGWIKLFGDSELALRAANIPFAIVFIGAISWVSRHLLREPNLWVLFSFSPFFWFYLNEARPYVALMAFSAVAIVALLEYLMYPTEYNVFAPWCCLISLLMVWGTHILGIFLFPSMFVLTVASVLGDPMVRRNFIRDWYRPILFCLPAFIALAAFYLGASANGINRRYSRPGLSNLAYVLYEFIGFGGLGPPRNDIRKSPDIFVFAPYWPLLLIGAVTLVGIGGFLFWARPPKIVQYLAASLLVGAAIALKISIIEGFQVLGRHMVALFPLFLITLMLWSKRSFSSTRTRYGATAALVAVGVTWGISDARLVFMGKYEKDSYRQASSIAIAMSRFDGGKILWAADPHTAHYYGIQVMKGQHTAEIGNDDGLDWPVSSQAVDAENWSLDRAATYLAASTTPTILVLSKADLFDATGAWHTLIQQRRPTETANLNAISIYEWQPETANPSAPLNPLSSAAASKRP